MSCNGSGKSNEVQIEIIKDDNGNVLCKKRQIINVSCSGCSNCQKVKTTSR